MMCLFVYRSNGEPLPANRIEENRRAWQTWNTALREEYGIRTPAGGRVVTADGVAEYAGNIKGVSIVEAENLDDAIGKARRSPSIAFGGDVVVIGEYQP